MILNDKQQEAYDLIISGYNIFITGAGGVGKSAIIKLVSDYFKSLNKKIGITSTTGISAILIGGSTLHSFLGIGLGNDSTESIITYILKNPTIRKRWLELEVLIIDEISMLSPELFDKLELIARTIRCSSKCFGGIQIILSGDFCQLPCISKNNNIIFCFKAQTWDKCIYKTIYFDKVIRQEDIKFQNCLNNIRVGILTDDDINILKSRVGVKLINDNNILPTKLFPLNKSVEDINNIELDKLAANNVDFYEYNSQYQLLSNSKNKNNIIDRIKKNFLVPEILQICIGAQVMLLINLDISSGCVNGSRGVVVDFKNDLPVVKFLNGNTCIIDYHTWTIEENNVKIMYINQIPLKVAYAISIHKGQGSTIDYAEIDLYHIFEYGQAYVALSRVKTLEGLSIINMDLSKFKAHPEAIEYYSKL
jgi:ATP-dependent DNA helicase PIF1